MDKNRWMEIITGVQIHLHMFSFRFISSSDILVKTSKLRPPRWYKDHGSPYKSGVLTEEGVDGTQGSIDVPVTRNTGGRRRRRGCWRFAPPLATQRFSITFTTRSHVKHRVMGRLTISKALVRPNRYFFVPTHFSLGAVVF